MGKVINIVAEPGDYIELEDRVIMFEVKRPFSMFVLANRSSVAITLAAMVNGSYLSKMLIPTRLYGKRIKITPKITLLKNN